MHPFYITVPIETGQAGSRAGDILWRSIIDSGALLFKTDKKVPMGTSININCIESVIRNLEIWNYPFQILVWKADIIKRVILGVYLVLCSFVWLNITDSVLEFIVSDNKVVLKSNC